jgi:glucose/arabinose dehydrogenase
MRSVFQSIPRAAERLIVAKLFWLTFTSIAIAAPARGAALVDVPQLGLRIAAGFRVNLFANETLADDIYAMTLNARGEVVVTGRGYIRTLLDDDGDGVADRAIDYAHSPMGGMGLCFDGDDLLFVGDGAVWRFQDRNGDRQADAAPERLMALQSGEHGGHAVHKGPDGGWYILGGNDSQFQMVPVSGLTFPPGKVEGGALLRVDPNVPGVRWVAEGFRNPYDFDWNAAGDLFTYDSDAERDFFLPWYLPTRIYHVAPGGHHGWRLEGYTRSWPRPGRYLDTVEPLAAVGRGSPTGVICYRHTQFPEY